MLHGINEPQDGARWVRGERRKLAYARQGQKQCFLGFVQGKIIPLRGKVNMEGRIEGVETRIAFLENGLLELDMVVRELGDQLMNVARELEELRTVVRNIGPSEAPEDAPPPHY